MVRGVTPCLKLESRPPSLLGDRTWLKQDASSLMRNAFDALGHRPRGGRRLSIQTRLPSGQGFACVAGNGKETAAAVDGKLFGPFLHNEDPRARNGPFDLALEHSMPKRPDPGGAMHWRGLCSSWLSRPPLPGREPYRTKVLFQGHRNSFNHKPNVLPRAAVPVATADCRVCCRIGG